jgi:hypothetical protein
MPDELELATKQTALVAGVAGTKMGTAIVTTERIVFMDTKFMGGVAGGALGTVLADALQKRHEQGGPFAEIPLASITSLRREKKLLNKDRIAVGTANQEYLFNDGWKQLSPVLKEALVNHHRRQVVEHSPDSWQVH